MRLTSFLLSLLILPGLLHAEIRTKNVEYRDGATLLEGYLAYDDEQIASRPGVLVVHEWWGLNDYARQRAQQLAQLGYLAFAIDMYGKGIRPTTPESAGQLAGMYKGDRELMRRRARAALDHLREHPLVEPDRIAAIGYCFGGTVALELSRDGAELAGVVSFHGGLDTPLPAEPGAIKGRVLICHGADDPHVPSEQVATFQDEMRNAGVDWQFVSYGNAVHAFTNPKSGDDPSKGVAYNALADRRSWETMKYFLHDTFELRDPCLWGTYELPPIETMLEDDEKPVPEDIIEELRPEEVEK